MEKNLSQSGQTVYALSQWSLKKYNKIKCFDSSRVFLSRWEQRGWSLCEIMDQAGAGFQKPGQQQRLWFPVEAGQDEYIKEICSSEGLIFNPARL